MPMYVHYKCSVCGFKDSQTYRDANRKCPMGYTHPKRRPNLVIYGSSPVRK